MRRRRPHRDRRRGAHDRPRWSTRPSSRGARPNWKLPEPRYTSGFLAKYAAPRAGRRDAARSRTSSSCPRSWRSRRRGRCSRRARSTARSRRSHAPDAWFLKRGPTAAALAARAARARRSPRRGARGKQIAARHRRRRVRADRRAPRDERPGARRRRGRGRPARLREQPRRRQVAPLRRALRRRRDLHAPRSRAGSARSSSIPTRRASGPTRSTLTIRQLDAALGTSTRAGEGGADGSGAGSPASATCSSTRCCGVPGIDPARLAVDADARTSAATLQRGDPHDAARHRPSGAARTPAISPRDLDVPCPRDGAPLQRRTHRRAHDLLVPRAPAVMHP